MDLYWNRVLKNNRIINITVAYQTKCVQEDDSVKRKTFQWQIEEEISTRRKSLNQTPSGRRPDLGRIIIFRNNNYRNILEYILEIISL